MFNLPFQDTNINDRRKYLKIADSFNLLVD
jgi:hypothetical protein